MKHLNLTSSYHHNLLSEFSFWCQVRSYKKNTIVELQSHIQEALHFIEKGGYTLNGEALNLYLNYLESRPNYRLKGGLSVAHLNKKHWALRLFVEYLSLVKSLSIGVHIPYVQRQQRTRKILDQNQISNLQHWINTVSQLRVFDSVLIAIFYGLGLRRSEGLNLKIRDINFTNSLLVVRSGKGGKSRQIPFNNAIKETLQEYLYHERLVVQSPYFFISSWRRKMSAKPIQNRLSIWQDVLKLDWSLTLHSLRHSIATHLLQSGMKLSLIQQFLGHQSLVSTQIYTHILNEHTL